MPRKKKIAGKRKQPKKQKAPPTTNDEAWVWNIEDIQAFYAAKSDKGRKWVPETAEGLLAALTPQEAPLNKTQAARWGQMLSVMRIAHKKRRNRDNLADIEAPPEAFTDLGHLKTNTEGNFTLPQARSILANPFKTIPGGSELFTDYHPVTGTDPSTLSHGARTKIIDMEMRDLFGMKANWVENSERFERPGAATAPPGCVESLPHLDPKVWTDFVPFNFNPDGPSEKAKAAYDGDLNSDGDVEINSDGDSKNNIGSKGFIKIDTDSERDYKNDTDSEGDLEGDSDAEGGLEGDFDSYVDSDDVSSLSE